MNIDLPSVILGAACAFSLWLLCIALRALFLHAAKSAGPTVTVRPLTGSDGKFGFYRKGSSVFLELDLMLEVRNALRRKVALTDLTVLLCRGQEQIAVCSPGADADPDIFRLCVPSEPLMADGSPLRLHFRTEAKSSCCPHFDTLVLRFSDGQARRHYLLGCCDGNWIPREFTLRDLSAVLAPCPAPTDPTGSAPFTSADRISYLQLIQEPISRMSTHSSIFKGFTATIVAGIAALSYTDIHPLILALSFSPIPFFMGLDMYYLSLERGFRYLYDQVRQNRHPVDFKVVPFPDGINKTAAGRKAARLRIRDLLFSISVGPFYIPMTAIALIVILLKLCHIL